MKVIKVYNLVQNDCTMDTQCEKCGDIYIDKMAYNDAHYKDVVVQKRDCTKCGHNTSAILKFTKGNWATVKNVPMGQKEHEYLINAGSYPSSKLVSKVFKATSVTAEEFEANAKLISAAPDLLAALMWLRDQIPNLDGDISLIGMSNVHNAIKKAIQ